jgi:hypothetical protein
MNPRHHPQCPRCKGEGFYLRRHGRGYYRDGTLDTISGRIAPAIQPISWIGFRSP